MASIYHPKGYIFKIYVLKSNRGRIFYVGMTCLKSITSRLSNHISVSRYNKTNSNSKQIRKLRFINIEEVERTEDLQIAFALEKKWIKYYLSIGIKLTNKQDCYD